MSSEPFPDVGRAWTIGSWEADEVTVAQVEDALLDLRRHEQWAAVRTSVLTLVAVVDDKRSADIALDVVHELGARHPSRTIVLVLDDEDEGASGRGNLDAAATVHVLERNGTAVSFEEVILRVRGKARHHLYSLIEPFTLPDLPVVVWLPSSLPSRGDPLLAAANRIVVDSRAVAESGGGGDPLGRISTLTRRLPVTDLSWTRLVAWRSLFAGLFEGGLNRPFLSGVREVVVAGNYGPRHLLGGWLLARLGLSPAIVHLESAPHASIRLTASAEGRMGRFVVERPSDERVIESRIDIDGGPSLHQSLPLQRQWPAMSLARALTDMGHDEQYQQALSGALLLRGPRTPRAPSSTLAGATER
ncbi:MAG TPA: glucose-6-phosphate dehydrogenase assembly protein OpcA [Acidimicrobiales bacterium]|nr:glucose-6-phosphate dehydrogenase assembly protein OpcA [Acidimicrobiales bacterium]